VLEAIDLETSDFFVDTEMVAKARKWNFRILQKGVRHYPRKAGESTVRAGHIPRTLRTIARMWLRIYLPTLVGKRSHAAPVCARLDPEAALGYERPTEPVGQAQRTELTAGADLSRSQ
jgi:hypothetical protein